MLPSHTSCSVACPLSLTTQADRAVLLATEASTLSQTSPSLDRPQGRLWRPPRRILESLRTTALLSMPRVRGLGTRRASKAAQASARVDEIRWPGRATKKPCPPAS
eukprot:525244-Alexandrium_andersonii.AAC.1